MLNFYDTVHSGLQYNKFTVGELLFVEYACPVKDELIGIWSHSDYLVHVLSGKKSWRTNNDVKTVTAGQTLFIKKGAAVTKQFFDDEFCMLVFFISDDFIKNTVRELSSNIKIISASDSTENSIIEVENDEILSAYFQSMLTYFRSGEKPANELLILKIKELIINILTGSRNPHLASYLQTMPGTGKPLIGKIMEDNFSYNLSLAEYAKLCSRSLSSFKRDFIKHFGIPPGKWLLNKRLEYARVLLQNSVLNISQIVFESGFEDLSHFSRSFKQKFGVSPNNFRKETALAE